jgi:shikimate kinase
MAESPAGSRQHVRRILLVGFMAAGKTTVGRILANRLGWRFRDVDEAIVRETGRTIAEIFASSGENVFRKLEAERTAAFLDETEAVISPGGGWAATSGSLDALPDGTVTVWLRVSAEEAVRRALAAGAVRPLLAGSDPVAAARELMGTREASYRRADLTIEVEGRDPVDIAADIEMLIRTV